MELPPPQILTVWFGTAHKTNPPIHLTLLIPARHNYIHAYNNFNSIETSYTYLYIYIQTKLPIILTLLIPATLHHTLHLFLSTTCTCVRDEKEERKKQARSNKQTRQSNTAHPRQSLFLEKMSCLRWDSNTRHSIL